MNYVSPLYLLLFRLCLILGLVLSTGQASAQQPHVMKDPTKWNVYFDKQTGLKVGDVVTLFMDTPIEKGYHIYSVRTYAKPGPSPTTFELDKDSKGIIPVGGVMDGIAPEKQYDDIFELDVYHFHNRALFVQKFKITDNNPVIAGALRYQYCTEEACQYGTLEIDRKLATEGGSSPTPTDDPKASADSAKNDSSQTASNPPTEKNNNSDTPTNPKENTKETASASGKLWESFIIAFLAGLLSLITPCVFPMIPMTVTFFLKRSKDRQQGIRNAMIYTASLIFIFVFFGLLITALFDEKTIYEFSVNSWVNLVLFAVIFMFGLSFLGMFEISLPSSWTTALDKQSDKGGIIGIFFMALVLVVASFSCIGPIAGTLFFEVTKGSYLGPLVGMTGYGLGFAIPFGLFALFPGWLQSLPKSGGWLNSVKVTLGFIEIALSMKFLSQTDLREQWGLLDRDIFLSIWIATFIILGIYLLGKLRLPHDSPVEKISVPRALLSVLSFGFALYLLPGLFGAPLSKMAGILPPPKKDIGVTVAGGIPQSSGSSGSVSGICAEKRLYADHLADHAPPGFCMFYDLDEAKAYAKKVNKPLFIDFTGHTCTNCRQMEQSVWPHPEIKKLLTEDYVMVSLYVDDKTPLPETIKLENGKKLRTVGDKWLNYQTNKYNIISQPYYVLTDSDDKMLVNSGKSYTPDVQEYKQFLEEGLKKFKENGKLVSN